MNIKIICKSFNSRIHLYVAAALWIFLAMGSAARAISVTNVIYYDTFHRTGPLAGTAPDTVDANGATWVGGYPTNGIVTDGTEASITNALGVVPPYENAYLPINIETGHVYIVTCTIVGNTNATGGLAFGYGIIPGLGTGPENNANWGIDWVAVNSSNNGCSYWSYGGIRNFQTSYPWAQSMTYSTVLNVVTNLGGSPTNMVGSFFTNGVYCYTAPYVAYGRQTEDNGTYVGYVFIGEESALAAGSFQNFSVTDIVLNATTPTILEQPNSLTATVGHTATFWVRGYALPDPTYQWMTNGVAIPGATNASYTTPALTTAYNAMQYSVQLSTAAGSVTSSSATLTVTAGTPTVYSVTKTSSPNNVVVNFSGPIDPVTGLNPANYAFQVNGASAGITVSSVSYGSSSNNVILQTSALNPNTGYYLAIQNVEDQFGEVMNASTNPVLPAGLVFYFRGDSGVELDANGNVAQWLDMSTNGNNASQFFGMYPNVSGGFIPSTQARPGTGTIGVNNTPAIAFNPANSNYLTVAASEQMNLFGDLTLYCYASPSNSSAQEICGENNGNLANAFEMQLDATSLSPKLLFGDGNQYGSFDSAGPVQTVAPHVWSMTSQIVGTNTTGTAPTPLTNSISWYVDGAPFGNSGLGHNLATVNYPGAEYSGKPVYIGGRMDHSAWMNGEIGELMLFGAPLSGADRTNVDNYLGEKYFSFSFATNLPSTLSTSNGFQVTYTIYPSQGSLHFTYQWQVNGANISGATSQSYTTPVLGPANSNTTYDVVVTLPNGTTYTSSPSTLIVVPAAPFITSAGIPLWEATGSTNIVVLFDVPLNPSTAAVAGNYSVSGATVRSAAMGLEPNKVILTLTAPLAAWNANPGTYTVTAQNVQDQAGDTVVPAASSVGIYPAATALWLEGNNGIVIDSGNSSYAGVDQWNDQSGNAADLVQQSATVLEPVYTTNYHGNEALQFSGTNATSIGGKGYATYLYTANPDGANDYPGLEITNDMSIFAVVTFNTLVGGTNGEIVSKTGSTSPNRPAPYDYYANATPATVWYRGNGAANIADTVSTAGPSVGFPHIMSGVQTGSTVSQFLDAAPDGVSTISIPEPYVDQGSVLTIGMRNDLSGNRLNGEMFELIMVGSSLDTNDIAAIHSYLASKYTIPTGTNAYPAITHQPVASTNLYAGSTLTISAAASGNPLALQWYSTNGTAVAGQTSATLSISDVQANNAYYLEATNIYGSIASTPVVLNVIQINTNPTNIVVSVTNNNQLVLSWPADHIGWQLQVETNSLAVGLNNNWVNVSGSTTTNEVMVPVSLSNGTVFYRLVLPAP